MSIKSRLEAKTGDLVARANDAKPAEQTKVAVDYKPKTGPGQMLAFNKLISEANDKVAKLETKLADFNSSDVARKLDPKTIKASHWANRNEASFLTKDFEALKAEIESAGGNVQPIKVRPVSGKQGEYEIVFGHRRHRACLELGIDVLALVEELSDVDLFAQMDRENRQRADLRPYEQGVMYARALDEGLFPSLRKMAEALGVDASNASKAISLARLPATVLAAFESPLVLQQAWASSLTDAIQKNPDIVLARAKEMSVLAVKLNAVEVFKKLVADSVVSNHTPASTKARLVKGSGKKSGKIDFNPKNGSFKVILSGLDAAKIDDIEAAVKKILG
jgi:ParB family transcriptional regulator, chromosome partitioning protein